MGRLWTRFLCSRFVERYSATGRTPALARVDEWLALRGRRPDLSVAQRHVHWMVQKPVRELQTLRGDRFRKRNSKVGELNDWLHQKEISGGLWELEMDLEVGKVPSDFEIDLFVAEDQKTTLRWDARRNVLKLDRRNSGRTDFNSQFNRIYEAPLSPENGRLKLHLLLDISSVEVFGNNGEVSLTTSVFPTPSTEPIRFWSANKEQKLSRFTAWKLRSSVPIALVNK
jgi:fructan beta-fructosidase